MSIDEHNPLHHKISQICLAGKQASVLTNRMLDFSRRNKAEAKPLDVNTEITNQESIIKHVIGQNITVIFEKSADLAPVTIEPSTVHQPPHQPDRECQGGYAKGRGNNYRDRRYNCQCRQ